MLSLYMFVILGFCAVSIKSRPVHNTNVIDAIDDTIDNKNGLNVQHAQYRKRRTVKLVAKGLEAMKSIVPGTKSLEASTDTMIQYERNGNFETAKKDFFSFQPKDVRDRNSNSRTNSWNHRPMYGKVLAGTVGNTRLILREGIKHKPTVLDIIHFELEGPQPKAITERIFYRTDSN